MDDHHYVFMEDCLKEFNYPNIHSLDDAEIVNVFSTSNRQFLVSWLLKQTNNAITPFVDNPTKEELAGMLCCSGFCNKDNVMKFMNGECETDGQFTILHKMFQFMKDVVTGRAIKEPTKFPMEALETVFDFNTNLFPMYGPKQTLGVEQREQKITEYRKEIEEIKTLLLESDDVTVAPTVDTLLKDQLATAMANLEANFPDFQKATLDIMQEEDQTERTQVQFRQNFRGTLQTCSQQATQLLELIKNMEFVMNFHGKGTGDVSCENKRVEMLRKMAELCSEINDLKKG